MMKTSILHSLSVTQDMPCKKTIWKAYLGMNFTELKRILYLLPFQDELLWNLFWYDTTQQRLA